MAGLNANVMKTVQMEIPYLGNTNNVMRDIIEDFNSDDKKRGIYPYTRLSTFIQCCLPHEDNGSIYMIPLIMISGERPQNLIRDVKDTLAFLNNKGITIPEYYFNIFPLPTLIRKIICELYKKERLNEKLIPKVVILSYGGWLAYSYDDIPASHPFGVDEIIDISSANTRDFTDAISKYLSDNSTVRYINKTYRHGKYRRPQR